MAMYSAAGYGHQGAGAAANSNTAAPLVVLFERDDAIAVPLISELRIAGYDVRSARTPVELFDLLGKNQAALVLVDLGLATAARREFWVALDAQRRGRSLQVMTFRNLAPGAALDIELDATPQPLADVDLRGPQDFPQLIATVRQRVPLAQATPANVPLNQPFQPGVPASPYGSPVGYPTPGALPGQGASYQTPQTPVNYAGYVGASPAGITPAGGSYQGAAPSPWTPMLPSATPLPNGLPPAAVTYGPAYNGGYPQIAPNGMMGSPNTPPLPGQTPGRIPGQAQPSSPFAHPSAANPFAPAMNPAAGPALNPAMNPGMVPGMTPGMGAASPFAQPYAINPFSGTATEERHTPPAASAPRPADPPASPGPFGFGAGDGAFQTLGNPFTSSARNAGNASAAQTSDTWAKPTDQSFSDTWTPPDADDPQPQRGRPGSARAVDPSESTAYLPVCDLADQRAAGWDGLVQDVADALAGRDLSDGTDDWGIANTLRTHSQREKVPTQPVSEHGPTAPVASARDLPLMPTKTEQALNSVLLEGALLTPSKLEVLKGVQQMLGGAGMRYKIGELALLFHFLSPDQLLAALLVSRGLVSPQQIAGLGRVKQELAASGMDHDLESLLSMFNILPEEQLRGLRAELA